MTSSPLATRPTLALVPALAAALVLLALTPVPAEAQAREVYTVETVGTGPDAWVVYRCYPVTGRLTLPQRLRR